MKWWRLCVVTVLLLGMVVSLAAFPAQEHQRSELEGRVRLVGSEPFARLVLTTNNGRDYYLEDEDAGERFAAFIGRTVRVSGLTGEQELTLAGTDRKIRQYYIREVSIEE